MSEVLSHWESCRNRFLICLPVEIPRCLAYVSGMHLLHLFTHLKNNIQYFLCDVQCHIFVGEKTKKRQAEDSCRRPAHGTVEHHHYEQMCGEEKGRKGKGRGSCAVERGGAGDGAAVRNRLI